MDGVVAGIGFPRGEICKKEIFEMPAADAGSISDTENETG